MQRPRISSFPLHKPFEKLPPTSAYSQIVLPLIGGFFTEKPYIVGTATVVSGYLAITARHVIEEVLNIEDSTWHHGVVQNRLSALQVLPGPDFAVWDIVQCWGCPHTDIAFLQFGSTPHQSNDFKDVVWKHPSISAFPPECGERIAAFGFRRTTVKFSKNDQDINHFDVDGDLMASVGIVREVFESKRDNVFLSFPCYQVSARFDSGMSGGPVFDESGALCGLVCSGYEALTKEDEPISYVCSLWPMFQTRISANRAGNYSKNVMYPSLELAHAKQIDVVDYDRLVNHLCG